MNEQAPTAVWYKIDPRRFSLRSIFASSPNLFVLLLAVVVLKLLRINPRPTSGFRLDQPHRPIELEQMPAAAQQTLRKMIDECRRHSFQLAYCHAIDYLGDSEGYVAHLLHAGGRIRCTAGWTREGKAIESGCTFASRMQDGALHTTSNKRGGNDSPPGIYALIYSGASIHEVFSNHQKLLQKFGEEAAVSLTAEQLPEESNEFRRRVLAFAIARGAAKPMTPAEVDRLTIVVAELVPEAGDSPFRSPREGAPASAPRSSTAWRSIGNGACLGFFLGALANWLFGPEKLPREKDWQVHLLVWGWLVLPPAAGAVMGWLVWRRAKRRAARTPFTT